MEATADVLVTDVAMPDISGVRLGEMLRQGHPQLRILFVTGYSPDDVEMAAEPGRTAIVSKPFQRTELLAALSDLLRPA
jgi:CheY-like chemotaxis protein